MKKVIREIYKQEVNKFLKTKPSVYKNKKRNKQNKHHNNNKGDNQFH